MKGMMQIVN